MEYQSELEEGGYPDNVIIGAAGNGRQAIFIDIGVGAHSGVTKILFKENGEYKSALTETEVPLTFKPYPLFSRDINDDGIIEVGIQAAPPETDHLPMAAIPWINRWYQLDGQGSLVKEPVIEEYSDYREGYRFIIPENWRGKYTIERKTDEIQALSSVGFIYIAQNEQRTQLITLHHIPKEDWDQKKQELIGDNRSYLLLGQNKENMLAAELPQSSNELSGDSLREYKDMLHDKESILESFVLEKSVVYKNARYGFGFSLPEGWEGYTIVTGEWEGLYLGDLADGSAAETGPVINIRHPQWTAENPRQDIPVMIFTLAQWDGLKRGEFHIGAAPVGPRELGRNGNYVLALPARYNYAFPAGYEEVERILESNPLKPID